MHDPMKELLAQEPPQVSICGIIAQEVLQGLKSETEFRYAETRLTTIPWLETTRSSYLSAAALSRGLREWGVSAASADALIAAVAIQHGAVLWTLDEDFARIQRHSDLSLYA